LNPLQKIENMNVPSRHKDTKVHKELIFNYLFLAQLRAFVPLWH